MPPKDSDASHSFLLHVRPPVRVTLAVVVGVCVGVWLALHGNAKYAPLAGWDTAAAIILLWVSLTVFRLDREETQRYASREDPGRAVVDLLLLVASVVSLVAVGVLLFQAGDAQGSEKHLLVGLGLVSVVASWAVVHTAFALRYARLYYDDPVGGIDFNEPELPSYLNFVYLALTVGMTYQVSDTNIKSNEIRGAVLHHAMLSFLFGTGILATAINLVAGLSH